MFFELMEDVYVYTVLCSFKPDTQHKLVLQDCQWNSHSKITYCGVFVLTISIIVFCLAEEKKTMHCTVNIYKKEYWELGLTACRL